MSIEIRGIAELMAKLGAAEGVNKLRDPMKRAVLRIQYVMQDYPRAPASSTYTRTGTLGRRWTTKIDESGNGLRGKVGNNTIYGPWVQSERFQTRQHRRTGWVTDLRAVRENEAAIVADFEREIQRALGE